MKSKIVYEQIGLSLHKIKPPYRGTPRHEIVRRVQWLKSVDAVAAVIIRPPGLCDHPSCVAQRYNDFVTLCNTGEWPKQEVKKEEKNTPANLKVYCYVLDMRDD